MSDTGLPALTPKMFTASRLCVVLELDSAGGTKAIKAPTLSPSSRDLTKLGMTASINHEHGCLVTCYLKEAAEGVLHSVYHATGCLFVRKEQIPADTEQS